MSKKLSCSITLLVIIAIAGCSTQPREHLVIEDDHSMTEMVENIGIGIPSVMEIELVELMAADRNAYKRSLQKLQNYYISIGNATKIEWAAKEMKGLNAVPHYRYIATAETLSPNLRAIDSIPAADDLYNQADKLYADGLLFVINNPGKLQHAIKLYNELIRTHTTSDKIDDAAYHAARIYEHFKDYDIAAIYYQRTFQWNANTPYPARFRAAYVLDKRLRKRSEALTLYRMAFKMEKKFPDNVTYSQQRIKQLTKAERDLQSEVEETKVK